MGGYLGATPVLAQVDGYNRSQTDALLAQKLALSGGVLTGLLDTGAIGQIKFPAAQNASTNANTLDDYEEGTWTPIVNFAISGDASVGTYTKIGRLVMLNFYIQNARTNSPGIDFSVSGLPYAMAPGVDHGAGTALPYNVSFPYASAAWRRYNDAAIGLLSSTSGAAWGWTSTNAFSTGLSAVAGQFCYLTT